MTESAGLFPSTNSLRRHSYAAHTPYTNVRSHSLSEIDGQDRKKRSRTTPEQLKALNEAFYANPMPTAAMRNILADKLNMLPRSNRRAKEKHDRKRKKYDEVAEAHKLRSNGHLTDYMPSSSLSSYGFNDQQLNHMLPPTTPKKAHPSIDFGINKFYNSSGGEYGFTYANPEWRQIDPQMITSTNSSIHADMPQQLVYADESTYQSPYTQDYIFGYDPSPVLQMSATEDSFNFDSLGLNNSSSYFDPKFRRCFSLPDIMHSMPQTQVDYLQQMKPSEMTLEELELEDNIMKEFIVDEELL
ncbi:hypothetical protein O9G_002559 [Rozella allomycis CSF55]|uniref:Homeobox domain-containing protein n=1 Tax=Rozella allomycis (strain CSF55) TaxID=988480 RepID=A0A075AUL5_ROZAC|nr:hypothetical protein O9G_002559 [Rozella allomycis CSF55]|eukprot:EPZ32207.1 hypothetical protein O9G_002559 [Rozella allomycis CSF55]